MSRGRARPSPKPAPAGPQGQHLTVGRFSWEQHRFPTVQL